MGTSQLYMKETIILYGKMSEKKVCGSYTFLSHSHSSNQCVKIAWMFIERVELVVLDDFGWHFVFIMSLKWSLTGVMSSKAVTYIRSQFLALENLKFSLN